MNEYQSVASCIRRTTQRDLEELIVKGIIKAVAKGATDPTKHYVLLRHYCDIYCDNDIGHYRTWLWDSGLILGHELFFAQGAYDNAEFEGVIKIDGVVKHSFRPGIMA